MLEVVRLDHTYNLNNPDKCNCSVDGISNGQKGASTWFANDVTLAAQGSYTWSFTDTHPKCYSAPDVCLLTYDIDTVDSSTSAVVIERSLNGHTLSTTVHSLIAKHNVTEDFDFLNSGYYNEGGVNTVTFTNNSPISVQINKIRVIRVYGMNSLTGETSNGCNNTIISPGNGSLDYTIQEYACNWDNCGARVGFSHWGNNLAEVQIPAGDSVTWNFTTPNDPSGSDIANYIGPLAVMFNFNNVKRGLTSLQGDTHYQIQVKDARHGSGQFYTIADYYHGGYVLNQSQFPAIDLAQWPQYYSDYPGTQNAVRLVNLGDVPLTIVGSTGGGIDIYRLYNVKNLIQDNFDNGINTSIGSVLQANNGQASTQNGQLYLYMSPVNNVWSQAGYVSKYAYDTHALYGLTQQGFEAAVDVAQNNNISQMSLMISPALTTSSDPSILSNWYKITKDSSGNIVISNCINGTSSEKYRSGWAGSTGQLKIKVSSGSIAFFENGNLRYAEPYALSQNTCYIYVYGSSGAIGSTGAFDNYSLYPASIARDDFKDGTNGWTIDSGNWTTQNSQIHSTQNNSHIHNSTAYSANRHVRADVQTLSTDATSSYHQWDVAWLYVKEQDGNNNVYALLKADGFVELSMYYQGVKTTLGQVQTNLSPSAQHSIAVSIIGTNAKVWVDGTLYINQNNSSLANIAGWTGLYGYNSTASFSNIAIFDEGLWSKISSSATNAGGSISPQGITQVNSNSVTTYTVTADTGYDITHLLINNSDSGSQNSPYTHQFSSVSSDQTISATFAYKYTIMASSDSNGSVTPSGTQTVHQGDNQSYTITPNSGYNIAHVYVDSIDQGAISTYTFNGVSDNHTISASFQQNPTYTITSSAGTGGTISPSGTTTVNYGGSQTYTISANSGYTISNVTVDGTSQGAISSYTFSNVQANHTISAAFQAITYTITSSAGTGGSISPSGTTTVNSGGSQSYTITANSNYVISNVTVDGTARGAISSYTFSSVQANHTISATFVFSCQSCYTCEATCEVNCETECEVACQSCNTCQSACQLTCQTCNTCQTTCELSCQSSCQLACQTCNTCQTTCELSCQTGCQVACQDACQLACQDCQSCQGSCQPGCYECQSCYTCQTCQDTCQVSCQTGCEVTCQPCQTTCQVACQSCQPCEGCQTCYTDCQECMGSCLPGCYSCESYMYY
jgi:hypothetical protein